MYSKFSMLMPVAYWLLHGGVSLLLSEIWEMSPCKKIVQAFTLWHDLLIDDVLDILHVYFKMILKYVICKAIILVICSLLYRIDNIPILNYTLNICHLLPVKNIVLV